MCLLKHHSLSSVCVFRCTVCQGRYLVQVLSVSVSSFVQSPVVLDTLSPQSYHTVLVNFTCLAHDALTIALPDFRPPPTEWDFPDNPYDCGGVLWYRHTKWPKDPCILVDIHGNGNRNWLRRCPVGSNRTVRLSSSTGRPVTGPDPRVWTGRGLWAPTRWT